MRRFVILLTVLVAAGGCSRDRRYDLEGQILAIDRARREITVRHDDVKGFMPGMTMPFKVRDERELEGRKPGDLIKAKLVVTDSAGRLEDIVRTGEAPLPADTPHDAPATTLEPGDTVADAEFVDHRRRKRRLSDWRGSTVAVTFVYTRCPLPDFCPLMDRNFAAVQQALQADPDLGRRVHLASVSFDPDYDSPGILRAYARKAGARDNAWSWLTGDRAAIDRFAAQFGVSILRGDRPQAEITHNLRTIVIDREGRVARIFAGNDWKPEQLLAALRAADGG